MVRNDLTGIKLKQTSNFKFASSPAGLPSGRGDGSP